MKYFLIALALVTQASITHGQEIMTIPSGASVTISANEQLSLGGLVLVPSTNFTLQQNTITRNAAISHGAINPSDAIHRSYLFAANTDAFTGTIRFYYDDAELGMADESSLVLNAQTGSQWMHVATTSRDLTANYIETQAVSFTGISEMTVTSIGTTLPLHWGDIKALRQNNNAIIQFTCYDMFSVDQLQVERSLDRRSWTAVQTIRQPAAGTRSYEVTDIGVPSQQLYYRVSSADIDGKRSYSSIAIVAAEGVGTNIRLLSNPVNGASFSLSGLSASSFKSVSLLNASGVRVRNWKTIQSSYDVGALPAGVYVIEIVMANGEVRMLKMLR